LAGEQVFAARYDNQVDPNANVTISGTAESAVLILTLSEQLRAGRGVHFLTADAIASGAIRYLSFVSKKTA
jgi:hypothetical protein